ncbi:MAG: pyruvate dehydrogenase (acetyl-transferring), homodimeric type [Actinobacteria bacterium]|uniref:Pyruvate dehydrogenase E1 component n=1 Tax=freshwater metagenome TaxID=449393 RepID=A0A6J6TKV7_9ZZZZ|nr:pyruvate dehydrogenase (acetyl-transferring), homodimeric type [Actinomycetota bacterium]MSX25380.1 pyruvate dehydrogenase (acetyl-transferring), homodimeric type [Actinomycetota bacterium]MSY46349.1 pyruvate dehydrogenase (acetyl-transferring), homodimeric type [Actinomycetota bacterium]MSY57248.1 pyruvate dehydrogenase (acetyl-transferring), homodimeric type [Actinomycetota bacterium]
MSENTETPDHVVDQLVDTDPQETAEWHASFDAALANAGPVRARYLMLSLLQRAQEKNVGISNLRTTDYINTIPPEREPAFPGDEAIERRIRAFIRWNAAMLVHRAQRPGVGVGGHISTYASSAALYEVGFNHFFRGKDHPGGGDQIYFQGHASPGMYARAFMEGRFTEHQLDGFRQEISHEGGGLSSYPHPRLMPEFWEFPTVSMGIGPINAIYQARFNRYLHNRSIKDTSDQHVWAFLGDGEMDEVESIGAIGLAAREGLDNLTFVINCNLQRLDGPVRGNGKVIQELESTFRGAGWNVIKVVWGREWDELLAQDREGALVGLMNQTPDGDYQTFKTEDGAYVRDNFFGRDPRTAAMVAGWSNEKIWNLKRGGHDYQKLFAAYSAATEHKGRPTVILAKTIKGWTLGSTFEGRNSTHQMKKMTLEDIRTFRDRLGIPLADDQLDAKLPSYFKPAANSPENEYLMERRRALGGSIPRRRPISKPLPQPADEVYDSVRRGSGKQEIATTMAFVRLLKDLIKDPGLGSRFVPIIPDEARTFGMDSLFPTLKIYSPHGQTYTSVDRELMLSYKESTSGVILHEGINEAGSVASFTAVGSSYATHDEPMIPIYIFYSMFGFQRTGDAFWAASDQMVRGFVLGATAGRTTLNGEGLQHEDGHSQLLASTNPAVVAYDPAFGFELGHIVKDGLRRMYGENSENVYYYLTVYNEPYMQPAEPENLDVDGVLRGIYCYSRSIGKAKKSAQILASGVGVNWALKAQQLLADDWGISASVWSVTSWNELRRDGLEVDRHNLLHPDDQKQAYITKKLAGTDGPVIAVSDFMRAVQDQVAPWITQSFASLGTDGFGLSDTRGALRRHFKVDAESIAIAVLTQLAKNGDIKLSLVKDAIEKYQIFDISAADPGNTEGSG